MHGAKKSRPPVDPPSISPIEHIRKLVEASRVDEARRYVEERVAEGDASVEDWARLLRPPKVRSSPRRAQGDLGADHAWLRDNREAFRDHWVALRDGKLLDADRTLCVLVDRLKQRGLIEGAFVVQVD